MVTRRHENPDVPPDSRALARRPEGSNSNVATNAAGADADPAGSSRLAKLYLSPLARLFALSERFNDLVSGPRSHDPIGWRQGVSSVVRVLRDERLRLQAIDASTRMAMRCRGGQRRIASDSAADLAAKADGAYDHEAGVKAQIRNIHLIMGERMVIYGTEFPELELAEEEESLFMNYIEERINRPRSHRRGAFGGSNAISVYIEPIQGLERALQRADIIEVSRQLERVSAHVVKRIEQRSVELDALNGSSPAHAAPRGELARRYFDITLEAMRLPLIDTAIAGILRCFGGHQRLAMEMEFRDNAESGSEGPTDARVETILERLVERTLKCGESQRGKDK